MAPRGARCSAPPPERWRFGYGTYPFRRGVPRPCSPVRPDGSASRLWAASRRRGTPTTPRSRLRFSSVVVRFEPTDNSAELPVARSEL